MTTSHTATLGMVLAEIGPSARLLVGNSEDLARPVRGASIVTRLDVVPEPDTILICSDTTADASLTGLVDRLPSAPSRILLLTSPNASENPAELAPGHTVVEAGGTVDPASVVLAVARAIDDPNETVTRRLASLQRSLTQVLSEPDPVVALLGRLKTTCNATVALVDKRGNTVHSTGPIPLSLLFASIRQTAAETQMVDLDGWYGVADRIHDTSEATDHIGWLLVVARRPSFPDAYVVSAVHVGTALVEASQRTTLVARRQERAIQAAVLEEALFLPRISDHPELTGRITSLGLSFDDELRSMVVQPITSTGTRRGRPLLQEVADTLERALDDAGIAHLTSTRDKYVVLMVQASPRTIRRMMVSAGKALPAVHAGVGRAITHITDVADSYQDAQLAVLTSQRTSPGPKLMSYDEFDFATKMFSDIGLERMSKWALDFLDPVEGREPLLEGLIAYFEHSQNMNSAAHALDIHHNSLRYRLSKIESLLNINLRDPAAVSSLFLALAARQLELRDERPNQRVVRGVVSEGPSDVEALYSPKELGTPGVENLGVVLNPER